MSGGISPWIEYGAPGAPTSTILTEGQYGTGCLAGIAIGMDVVNNTNKIAAIDLVISTNTTAVATLTESVAAQDLSQETDIAIGLNATTTSETAGISIGLDSSCDGLFGVSVGKLASSTEHSVAIGYKAVAGGIGSMALGYRSNTNGHDKSIVIGHMALASGQGDSDSVRFDRI